MNSFIEILNRWGGHFLHFAWPMLWQSSALIGVIFILDLTLRRKVRAAIRYGLWLVVLVKLLLPPALALPTGAAWWLFRPKPAAEAPAAKKYVVTYDTTAPETDLVPQTVPLAAPKPRLGDAGWALLASAAVSAGLLLWLAVRWRQVARKVCNPSASEEFGSSLETARRLAGLGSAVRLKLVEGRLSPAVCGLFRPVILLPRTLAENLTSAQLRAVLLHELFHLRRKDVWVNCAQALLQIVYWWHPLLWLANARIRRAREEAVDDAVMLALRDEAEIYAPTLLEVAKLAFRRPLLSLGLVGIMESRSALRQRIERLINFDAPKKAGLTILSILGILAFSAVALPMGEAPEKPNVEAVSLQKHDNPTVATNTVDGKIEAGKLVQDGKLLYEMGKFDDAETKLNQVLKLDADNQAAFYYLNLVRQARFAREEHNRSTEDQAKLAQTAKVAREPQTVHTSPGRETILNKLRRIQLDHVFYDRTPLDEVVPNLSVEVKQRDPDKKGINFLINPNVGPAAAPRIDPATGMPVAAAPAPEVVDIKSITVSIKPALTSAHLGDVLDAIVYAADKPIKYSVEDYGIVFSLKDQNALPLEMRTFRVDAWQFGAALRNSSGMETTNVSAMAESYFRTRGVDLSAAGRSIAWNDRLGLLFVKATSSEMDTIERAVVVLNQTDPQVHIKAWFIEVPKKGFVMPQTLTNLAGNPMVGILSSRQAKNFLHLLEKNPGTEILAEPEAVSSSGRQTQMRATVIEDVLTNYALNETSSVPAVVPQIGKFEFGPTVDVVPYVLSDGYTINLTVIPEIIEFLGYEPANGTYATNKAGKRIELPTVKPGFRIHETKVNVNLWDNQTIVLGNITNVFFSVTNGVQTTAEPKWFIDEEKKKPNADKELLLLVTATIVDPAGNRVYSDDELPFNPSTVPPQPQLSSPSP